MTQPPPLPPNLPSVDDSRAVSPEFGFALTWFIGTAALLMFKTWPNIDTTNLFRCAWDFGLHVYHSAAVTLLPVSLSFFTWRQKTHRSFAREPGEWLLLVACCQKAVPQLIRWTLEANIHEWGNPALTFPLCVLLPSLVTAVLWGVAAFRTRTEREWSWLFLAGLLFVMPELILRVFTAMEIYFDTSDWESWETLYAWRMWVLGLDLRAIYIRPIACLIALIILVNIDRTNKVPRGRIHWVGVIVFGSFMFLTFVQRLGWLRDLWSF